MAAVAGLYRRKLPSPPAIEFASPEGKRLFSEALWEGNMEGFFTLISYYQTQSEPAYCGLATLSMVLNALAIDPGRKWKGPWRWFDDTMLDCCETLEKVKVSGTTFDQVACLARCNGAKVEAFHTDQSTIENFRNYVVSCTSSEGCHLIISYHRGCLEQTGTGHFSPAGGYHAKTDSVLILDVARFKYPPHWVPLTLLWEAMDTVDEATGCHRGFMILSKHQRAPTILYTVEEILNQVCSTEIYEHVTRFLSSKLCCKLAEEDTTKIALELCCQAAQIFCGVYMTCCKATDTRLLKDNDEKPILMVSGKVNTESSEQGIDILVPRQSKPKGSCDCVSSNGGGKHPSLDDVVTILLLALPAATWSGIKHEVLKKEISRLLSTISLPPLLQEEVQHLRQQLYFLSANI